MVDERPRPMTRVESELLETLLGHDFPGVEALRDQMNGLLVMRDCRCGCGTLSLFPRREAPRWSSDTYYVPVSGYISDDEGSPTGGFVLSAEDGLLKMLEVYWYDDPIPMPAIKNVEWQV